MNVLPGDLCSQPQTSLSFEGLSERHFKRQPPHVREPAAPAQKDTFTSQPAVPEGSGKESDSPHFLSCFLPQPSTAGMGEMGPQWRWVVGTREGEESVNAGHQAALTGTQP